MTILEKLKRIPTAEIDRLPQDKKDKLLAHLQQLKLESDQKYYKNSLYDMARDLFGYTDLVPNPHRKRSKWLQGKSDKFRLWLAPRDSFKSSISTCSLVPFKLAQNPELRIMITSCTYGKSLKFIDEVIGNMMSPRYIKLFGDPSGGKGTLSREGFDIAQKSKRTKERSVFAGGVDKSTTGMHPDIIIADDLVDKETTTNIDMIMKTIRYAGELSGQLEEGGELYILGTRWDYADLYNHIIVKLNQLFDIVIDKAIQDDGSLYFKERLSHKYLETRKLMYGEYGFSCQYQQEPVSSDSKRFKMEKVKKYTELPKMNERQHFLMIDPALTEDVRLEGCFTGIVYLVVDKKNNWYVEELHNMKATTDELVDKIYDIVTRKGLYKVHIEKAQMGALEYALHEKFRQTGRDCQVEPLKHAGRAKLARIEGLQPIVEQGKLWIKDYKDEEDPYFALEYQLNHFPKVHPIDLLDALAYGVDLVNPRFAEEILPTQPRDIQGTMANFRKRAKMTTKKYI